MKQPSKKNTTLNTIEIQTDINETDDKNATKNFAQGLCFYKLFWVFFIGCFLGVVIETLWFLVTRFQLVNRTGLVYGPFNLVYGCGAVLMTLCLWWLRNKRDLWIFIFGAFLGGAYEFFCSWIQEALFGTVSWEYSNMPFNLYGRINLLYSLFWGILALLWIKEIYPRMSALIEKIPNRYAKTLTWILVVFMIINVVMSGLAVWRMSQRRENIPATNTIQRFFDNRFNDERMQKIYPSMMYVENTEEE